MTDYGASICNITLDPRRIFVLLTEMIVDFAVADVAKLLMVRGMQYRTAAESNAVPSDGWMAKRLDFRVSNDCMRQ